MTRPYKIRFWRIAVTRYIRSRHKVRRANFAVAMLRKEAAAHRRLGDRSDKDLAAYLDSVADLIEQAP